ncbi:MAG: lycopene cyclase domain-containing protein [Halobacteriaceae archaeon]
MSGPTYVQFHVALLVPVVAVLVATAAVFRPRMERSTVWTGGATPYWYGVAAVTVVAVLYTTPWDNYLIARGVWGYGEGRVLARFGLAPVGEYAFFVLQPLLTALWLGHVPLRRGWPEPELARRGPDGERVADLDALSVAPRLASAGAGVGVGLVGWTLLASPATFYLGAVLAWAAPVLVLQWAVGAPQLWYQRRAVALGVAAPTLYLWGADRIALDAGIWYVSPRYTTGDTLFGLPVEEALFFLVTTLFVVQGLVLFRWVTDRWA